MATITGRRTVHGIDVLEVDGDPSSGSGTFAPIGSIATTNNGLGTYVKIGTDNTAWSRQTRVGNTGLLNTLDGSFSQPINLFVDSITGSDITGDGLTTGTAFASIQRALDEIPDGASGFVQIKLIGVGPYKTWRARNYHS